MLKRYYAWAVDSTEVVGDGADIRAFGAHADDGVVKLVFAAEHFRATLCLLRRSRRSMTTKSANRTAGAR